jgi:hypothetical protein
MVWCQVIKGNNKPCANYARKGLTCCYPHRRLERVEPEKVKPIEPEKVKPVQVVGTHKCCCLNMKGNPCTIVAEHIRGECGYCWRHFRHLQESENHFDINPTDSDDIWNQLIDASYETPGTFIDALGWIATKYKGYDSGPCQFTFHKSMPLKHMLQIMGIQSDKFSSIGIQGRLVVKVKQF